MWHWKYDQAEAQIGMKEPGPGTDWESGCLECSSGSVSNDGEKIVPT
jgi:hypothetical protein